MGREDAVDAMRAEVSAALVAADYDTDLGGYQWHPCDGCSAPCACAGIPWLNDATWEVMRPHLLAAVDAAAPHLLAVERARIARAIRTDCRHGLMYAQGWYIGCPPCAACNDAAYIAEGNR